MTISDQMQLSFLPHSLALPALGVLLLSFATIGGQECPAQTSRGLSVDDNLAMKYFGEYTPIEISPDGKAIAYTVRSGQHSGLLEPGSFVRSGIEWWSVSGDVQVVDVATRVSKSISKNHGNSSLPSWSPNGRWLAFLSDQDGQEQAKLWIWNKDTDQMRKLSEIPLRCEQIEWSPDSRQVVTTVLPIGLSPEDYVKQASPEAETSASNQRTDENKPIVVFRSAEEAPGNTSATVAGSSPWNLNRYLRDLVAIDVQTGEVNTLVKGGRISRFSLSPDGSRIVYTEPLGFEHPGSQQILYDLVLFDRRNRGRVTLAPKIRLDYDGAGFSWSTDGTRVSFFSGGPGTARAGLYVVAVDHPEPLVTRLLYDDAPTAHRMPPVWDEASDILTIRSGALWRTQNGKSATILAQIEGWTIRQVVPQSPDPIGQRRDARRVVVVAANGDSKAEGIFSIDLDTGGAKELLGGMECIACGSQYLLAGLASRGSVVAFLREDSAHPSDLWVLDSATGTSDQLTRLNPQLDRYEMGSTRLIDWLGIDGQRLQGALLLPADYQTGRRYPLVTVVYAGAHPSYFLNRFGTTGRGPLNPQLLATRGYAVLFPDSPQGVGSPMMDLLKTVLPGVNKVIAMGIADQDRLGVMGHSNGGYSTVALITQTHRFKAAVEIAGLSDLIGAYGEMDKAGKSYASSLFEQGQDALGGTPWEEWDKYVENSPLYYLDHVATPLLMAHGERDIYVAPFLADELFVGLRRLGKEAEYVKYIGEGHDPVAWSYANQVDLSRRILSWFEMHIPSQK